MSTGPRNEGRTARWEWAGYGCREFWSEWQIMFRNTIVNFRRIRRAWTNRKTGYRQCRGKRSRRALGTRITGWRRVFRSRISNVPVIRISTFRCSSNSTSKTISAIWRWTGRNRCSAKWSIWCLVCRWSLMILHRRWGTRGFRVVYFVFDYSTRSYNNVLEQRQRHKGNVSPGKKKLVWSWMGSNLVWKKSWSFLLSRWKDSKTCGSTILFKTQLIISSTLSWHCATRYRFFHIRVSISLSEAGLISPRLIMNCHRLVSNY